MAQGLFGAMGTGIRNAVKEQLDRRQQAIQNDLQQQQLEIQKQEQERLAANDLFNRRNAFFTATDNMRNYLLNNSRYASAEDRALYDQYFADADTAREEFINGDETAIARLQNRYAGGVLGTRPDGTPVTFSAITSNIQTNKPKIDQQDKLAATIGDASAEALLKALGLATNDDTRQEIQNLILQIQDPASGVSPTQALARATSLVYGGLPSQWLASNRNKLSLPATLAEGLLFLQTLKRDSLPPEEQAEYDRLAALYGGFDADGKPLNPNDPEYVAALRQREAYDAKNQQEDAQLQNILATTRNVTAQANRIETLTPSEVLLMGVQIRTLEQDLAQKADLHTPAVEQARLAVSQARLAYEKQLAVQLGQITRENAENTVAAMLAGVKGEADRAEALRRIVATGRVGKTALTRMRDAGTITATEFAQLEGTAALFDEVNNSQLQAILAQNQSSIAQSELSEENARKALENIPLTNTRDRATYLTQIAVSRNSKQLLDSLLASGEITKDEYAFATEMANRASNDRLRATRGAEFADATNFLNRYISVVATSGNPRSVANNLRLATESADDFKRTAAALGMTVQQLEDYLTREGELAKIQRGNEQAKVNDALANSRAARQDAAGRLALAQKESEERTRAAAKAMKDGKDEEVRNIISSLSGLRLSAAQRVNTIRAANQSLSTRGAQITSQIRAIEAKTIKTTEDNAQLAALRQELQDINGEVNNNNVELRSVDKLLADYDKQLNELINWQRARAGIPTNRPAQAPQPNNILNGSYTGANGQMVTGNPQRVDDFVTWKPSQQFIDNSGLSQITSQITILNGGDVEKSDAAQKVIEVIIADSFKLGGFPDTQEMRRYYVRWIEKTYGIIIPKFIQDRFEGVTK